jgi:uncharacterized protein DUF4112
MKAQEIEWEVLPPEEKQKQAKLEPFFKWLALILDQFLRLPGTKFRFGLDPIIGLIPGIGDTASALISAFSLVYAARCGLPKALLARMSVNILLNEIIGIIPGVGDAFSFWFKSNQRNYELLQRHMAAPGRARKSDWVFVAVVLGLLFVIVCAGVLVSLFVLQQLFQILTRSQP